MGKIRHVLDNNTTIIIIILIISIIGGSYFKGKQERPNKVTVIFLVGIIVLAILYFIYMLFLK
jgi:type IV secretory pathway VirB2 component (pilin)